jgi:hypothetical protein
MKNTVNAAIAIVRTWVNGTLLFGRIEFLRGERRPDPSNIG